MVYKKVVVARSSDEAIWCINPTTEIASLLSMSLP